MEIMVQLLVGEWGTRLVEWIIKPECTYVRKVSVQNFFRGLKADQRVMDRHGEVAGCHVFFRVDVKLIGQDFIDLGVQDCDRAGFGSRKFFLQGDRFFQFSDLLQDFDDRRNSTWIVEQIHETFLDIGMADDSIEFMEQGLTYA